VSADNAGNQFSQVWSSKEPHLGCCRFLHFRPHLVTFRRHVQFDEYIKGGSQLFPLRLAKRNLLKGDLRITKRLVSAHEFFKSIFWIM
jgi:hypothetical protein